MTMEAFVLSCLDDLDAKMNLMEQLRKRMKTPGLQWTEYQRSLERYLYLGPVEDRGLPMAPEDPDDGQVQPAPVRQPTLF
jgi:3'-5' exoribonuclease